MLYVCARCPFVDASIVQPLRVELSRRIPLVALATFIQCGTGEDVRVISKPIVAFARFSM